MYFVRIKVAVPPFDIFGMALYPEPSLDIPSFACDFSCTRKKVFAYINVIPLFDDHTYRERYIEPLRQIHERYRNFPRQKSRAWMEPYMTPYTIYSFPEKTVLPQLQECALVYLDFYLKLVAGAETIGDASYRDRVVVAQQRYLNDLSANDASRKMLGRIIGRAKADRFFKEVVV